MRMPIKRWRQGDELHPGKEFEKVSPARKPAKIDKDKSDQRDVGSALRSVYRETIEEDVPAEMLDLLGKLD